MINSVIAECYSKIEPIDKRRAELACEVITEDNLLEDTQWILADNGATTLNVDGDIKNQPKLQSVVDIVRSNFYGDVTFEPGVRIEFSYDDLRLFFDDAKLVAPFAKRYKLIINTSNVIKKLRSLKREVAGLESLCHLLNIKA